MASNLFTAQIGQFIEKAKGNADLVVRKVALEMFSRVIQKSPVGNPDLWADPNPPPGYVGGRFKSNWQVSIGSIPNGTISENDQGASAIAQVESVTLGAKAGDKIYLINNLSYGPKLEWGYSKQAPAGMVRITVGEFGSVVNQAASELPK